MKRFGLFVVITLALGLFGVTQASADNLVVNGSFESPVLSPASYAQLSNGSVPGWTTTDPGGLIEIDNPFQAFPGGVSAYDGNQSLEVNANNPESVIQTISGLTVGGEYALSWAYGERSGSGPQELQVYFGGVLIATETDDGSNGTLVYAPGEAVSFAVFADGITMVDLQECKLSWQVTDVTGKPVCAAIHVR